MTIEDLTDFSGPCDFSEGFARERARGDIVTLPAMFVGLTLSALMAAPANSTPPCTPARLGANVSAQPEAWRKAIESLVSSTAAPGLPWSCVGGEVDLVMGPQTATLTVMDSEGHTVSREVSSPDDIGPLGEALLAKPLAPPPAPEAAKEPPVVEKKPSASAREPRLLVAATMGPRYAGPAHLLWGGFTFAAMVPFRPWGGGIWLRYDGFSRSLAGGLPAMRELCIGVSAFRSFSFGSVEIRPGLRPSLAIITSGFESRGDEIPDTDPRDSFTPDETRFDFRVGLDTQIAIAVTKRFRALFTLDGELAPGEILRRDKPSREVAIHFPTYTFGLGLGMEMAIP